MKSSMDWVKLGLDESPLSSWQNYESFQNVKFEDEYMCMSSEESIIQTSELETSYKEMQNIEEVTVSEEESLRKSIMEEMFPEGIHIYQDATQHEIDTSFEQNQQLIAKVEDYIISMSGEPTKIEEDVLAMSWQLSDLPSPGSNNTEVDTGTSNSNVPEKTEQTIDTTAASDAAPTAPIVVGDAANVSPLNADKILNSLMSGNVVESAPTSVADFESLPNSFTAVGANGEKVIILIAPPMAANATIAATPQEEEPADNKGSTHQLLSPPAIVPDYLSGSEAAMSPAAESCVLSPRSTTTGIATSDDDEDWKPDYSSASETVTAPARPRKKYERKVPSRGPRPGPYPQNKVERKKAQNRSAAWRYREKKKQEQVHADSELEQLMDRNAELKKHLADVELQMKCVKQLMTDAGLGHLLRAI